MINGLGIVGWGVGGIEAEAGMLGQPVYFLTPDVVGVHLTGALREGVTATDLALTVTEMLRKAKVVGKFVEFYGPGAAALPVVDRATIANMAPEYGATMGFFPMDAECVDYLRQTGRSAEHCRLYENYFRAQGLFGMPKKGDIAYSTDLELDLAGVRPSVAGPKRPQDRIELAAMKEEFRKSFSRPAAENGFGKPAGDLPRAFPVPAGGPAAPGGGQIHHGDILIAAITSCTNTSNPSVMLAAGLLAKKAVERGLEPHPLRQGVARARFAGGHRLLDKDRLAALPGPARLQPGRLRLHHLHRQLRPAGRARRGGRCQERRHRRRRPFRQPQLRGARPSRTSRPTSSCPRRWSSPSPWPAASP